MKKKSTTIYRFCLTLFGLIIFFLWQNNQIVSDYLTYTSDKVTADLDGYTIVHISDLHNKRFGKNQITLINAIKAENPDILVITGDLVDSNHTNIDYAMEFINEAIKLAPIYYVTGNHECWLDSSTYDELMNTLEKSGVHILNNEAISISVNQSSFTLIGLDDRHLTDNTLASLTDDQHTLQVLLAHEPQHIEAYAKENIDLVLSGHAHGGQFRLPFVGGIYAPNQGFFPDYTEGLYTEGDTSMYVSRGLGNSVIPIRIFNRPEIVVVDFDR